MRGQVFTLDMFAAYAIFLVMMLMITFISLWVSDAILTKDKTDGMSVQAIAALDHLCYGNEYTGAPYLMDVDAIDGFFAAGTEAVRSELRPGWNYSLKLMWPNGTLIHSAGEYDYQGANIIAYSRVVSYNDENAKLVMAVWEEKEVEGIART